MGTGIRGGVVRQLQGLFDSGTLGALDDGELLGRFLRRDASAEAAFAALVARHGGMVHRVCLDVLGDAHDAQDAAQATFLVLARKGATIARPEALPAWLHGTARRVAGRALRDAIRRKRHERRKAEVSADGPEPARDWSELHEELGRLPARYREPIVLCDLAGLSHDQAARQLGAPLRTLQTRLHRGRERLKGRLIRRGLAPSAAFVGLAWTCEARAASVPIWASAPAGGSIPPGAAATLARAYLKEMIMIKLKGIAAVGLLAGVAAGGAWSVGATGGAGPRQAQEPAGHAPLVAPVALDAFERTYALADGEDLKCIQGPAIRARVDHFRDKPGEIGIGQGSTDGPLSVGFEWDAGHWGWITTTSPGGVDLRSATANILGLREQEIEGDPKFLETTLLFDYVVRKNAPIEKRAGAWEATLRRDFRVPARLSLAVEKRDVIVVRGRFPGISEIQVPAGAPKRELDLPTIEVFTRKVGRPGMANYSYSSGIFLGFLRSLERQTGRLFANEVAGIPDGPIRWHTIDDAKQPLGAEDRALMLGNLTAQTGLTFWEEPRDVTILKVERVE